MDTRNRRNARARARGAVRPVTVAVLAVLALLAIAAWFLIIQPHQQLVMQDAGGHPSSPVSAGRAAAPPANVEAMDLNQLLSEARKAMNEQRLLAPAGNNAYEFYLKALEKQPGNSVATDALRETFPFAATSAEQTINQRDFNEAQRQIDLLAKADPANYTLTILRSKLDAQRKLLDKEQQLALDQQKQAQLAAQKAANDKVEADKLAEQQKAQLAAQQKAEQARAEQQRLQAQQQATAAANPAQDTAAVGASSPAILIKNVLPRYPTQAKRANQEGWVDVEYTITVEGDVSDVKVTGSQPRHVFEREATDAVERWKFKPAMRDGTPVASRGQKRILFKLKE
ncbi:energy transducer TonB [Frateuria sp. Soil773]|uniref:energy transducer TonB n=1 Tax=Frateuria sp. Soil773 TaxID=1736407 RepID=UPI0006FE5A1D|nr:energy transducer TonB [Frateuria sp. Soil773]KRE99959.1 energy transducer TonB [Frateuria sp. Soil773]